MQQNPLYDDVVSEVRSSLEKYQQSAISAGISPNRIALDPGIGFGKTREHNLALLNAMGTEDWPTHGQRTLVGPSRKSFIGQTLDLSVEERLEGTAAVVAWLVARGVSIIRVHDVKEMVRVARMVETIRDAPVSYRGGEA